MPQTSRLFLPWVALATICCALMWVLEGSETVPYHLAWVGIAVAYGLEPWPTSKAYAAVAGLTVVSGLIMLQRAASGVIAWEELTEVPLMPLIVGVCVWHVRRRYDALAALTEISARDADRAARRERLSRMTSHEMRTPTTIAVGYLELLLAEERDPARRDDFGVVLQELDRVLLSSDRLVRMLWLPDQDTLEQVDVDGLLRETCARWRVLAERDWQVSSDVGVMLVSAARLRSCLDTLLENSVRYTQTGDVVRLVSSVRDGWVSVGVEDSGPGFDPVFIQDLAGDETGEPAAVLGVALDPKRQTGLGLGLVREAVGVRGGSVRIGRSPEGGAQVLMVAPVDRGTVVTSVGEAGVVPTPDIERAVVRVGAPVVLDRVMARTD